jgi:hypothetical protein
MKGLATLIKLHKRTLDELRRSMVSLENQKAQLIQLAERLKEELRREIELAGSQIEMAHFFGDFAKRMRARQDEVAAEITEVEKKIVKLNDQIAEAFAELKKFEIAQANAKQRAAEAARRKEDLMLDEIAAQQHRRKNAED